MQEDVGNFCLSTPIPRCNKVMNRRLQKIKILAPFGILVDVYGYEEECHVHRLHKGENATYSDRCIYEHCFVAFSARS